MSVKVMSAIFETEFRDLPLPPDNDDKPRMARASSLKIVLLAIADHANDEGESAYPGLTRLEKKTGMSRQGIVDVLSALKYNGLLTVADNPSRLGTNDYTLNLDCFPCLKDDSQDTLLVKPLDYPSQVTLPAVVKPLDLKHPLTTIEPSINNKQSTEEIPALHLFTDHFGKFKSEKEVKRWLTIVDAVGMAQADTIAAWAEKRDIHMDNRPGLMDSLETAAKGWREKQVHFQAKTKGDRSELMRQLAEA